MKKSIFTYLLFSLLCISNITWALAQYASIESVMKYYTPAVSVVSFASPGAFSAEGVSTYDKAIAHTRYYFKTDRVANIGTHIGEANCLPSPVSKDAHPMTNYLNALK